MDTNGLPLAGVTVALNGDSDRTTNTTALGEFVMDALPSNGTFVVTPALDGRLFEPSFAAISNLIENEFVLFLEQPLQPLLPPILAIEIDPTDAGQIVVTWPGNALDFVLESSPSLSEPDWQPAPEQQLQDVGQVVVLLNSPSGQRFLRLRNP